MLSPSRSAAERDAARRNKIAGSTNHEPTCRVNATLSDPENRLQGGNKPLTEPMLAQTLRTHLEGPIEVQGVRHLYGFGKKPGLLALDSVSLTVGPGEFIAIVGPSGCGKTTLLNMMAGLVQPTYGTVKVEGATPRRPRRDVGYMFARDGLLPWRTAQRNVEYGLEIRGVRKSERQQQARRYLELLGLARFGHAYPGQLSHGMRQRVALARTLAYQPRILLLDEPFAALDAQTKLRMQELFLSVWDDLKLTAVLITHDLNEAVSMADRVFVMTARPGQIKEELVVDIPRPRDLESLPFSDTYRDLAGRAWQALREELHDKSSEVGQ